MSVLILQRLLLYSLLPFGWLGFYSAQTASGQAQRLVNFEMEDQFGVKYQRADLEGKVVVIIGSDRSGSRYNEQWGVALDSVLQHVTDVTFLPVANVNGVPWLMRQFVRKKLTHDLSMRILLDWDGIISKTYRFKKGETNIAVFSRDGFLIFQGSGRNTNPTLIRQVEWAVKEANSSSESVRNEPGG